MYLQNYYNNFSKEKFAENLSLEIFWNSDMYFQDNRWNKKHEFVKISSNSSLRNVFDSYLKIFSNYENNKKDIFDIDKEILFAKIAYQEQRKILTKWFTEFLRWIYKKIDDPKKFKQFLEVFVAYHKYFNPSAK